MSDEKYAGIQWTDSFDPDAIMWTHKEIVSAVPVFSTFELAQNEASAYVIRGMSKFSKVHAVFVIGLDNDEVEVHYEIGDLGFERIRRITGYLVGTLDRFNDAKRAEESQRVKHRLSHQGENES